jgi:acyl-CoA hydrolase/RimJ/RimL family protein N-acetyltransferase
MPTIQALKKKYPGKFVSEDEVFASIHRGDRIFISTGCGEPQYLVGALIRYVESHPKAVFDAEVFQVWTLGVAPYTDDKFKSNFRHNSFFIGNDTRGAINRGAADYTPIFLSQVPGLLDRRMIPVDVALVQVSVPDAHGYVSLGVSVDIVKSAVGNATTVVAQLNSRMPRVHGDGFVHVDAIDYIVPHDEELLVYEDTTPDEIAHAIGRYVARIVRDGDTIQVGYGSLPNAIIANLENKEHLGVHTELFSDGIAELMQKGVIDNSRKTINRGKTVTTFCMGRRSTYDFIDDNPAIEFRTVDYTNDPLVIAQHKNMVAINSALAVDLTGQATAESIGTTFYSGIGGQADFMRGAILSPGGRTILALASTAEGGTVSRIVPFLREGEGVTLNRGDIHYVVTEYGIAYLHGKNIRERAMELIAVAHPDFRAKLIEEARRSSLIYKDQAFIPGKEGWYPEYIENYRTTGSGLTVFLRPVKISDEGLLKDFFYDLSDKSIYRRFFTLRPDMPHERLQSYVIIDYTKEIVILASIIKDEKEVIVGMGQYIIGETSLSAEVAFIVKDEFQNRGIGTEIITYLTYLAKRRGLTSFTAEVLVENKPMIHVFEKAGFDIEKRGSEGVYEMKLNFVD